MILNLLPLGVICSDGRGPTNALSAHGPPSSNPSSSQAAMGRGAGCCCARHGRRVVSTGAWGRRWRPAGGGTVKSAEGSTADDQQDTRPRHSSRVAKVLRCFRRLRASRKKAAPRRWRVSSGLRWQSLLPLLAIKKQRGQSPPWSTSATVVAPCKRRTCTHGHTAVCRRSPGGGGLQPRWSERQRQWGLAQRAHVLVSQERIE